MYPCILADCIEMTEKNIKPVPELEKVFGTLNQEDSCGFLRK